MINYKPVSTPMAAHFKLSCQQCPSTDLEQYEMSKVPYTSSIDCLMYAMVLTRPNLSYAVRRSLIGFLFTLNNCTINWKASLQSVVALSTTEAEYTATAEAFKEAIWLKDMINELGYELASITVLCDSQSAINLKRLST